MGAYLGQNGTLKQRSNKIKDHELGIDPGSIITAGGAVLNLFNGGSSCSDSQKQQRQRIEQDIRQYLTQIDMNELVEGTESNVSPNPVDMAYFALGGKDCLHKNVSPNDQRFLNELPQRISQRKQEAQSNLPQLPGGMSVTTAGISPVLKYPLIIATAGGVVWLGYQGISKLKES